MKYYKLFLLFIALGFYPFEIYSQDITIKYLLELKKMNFSNTENILSRNGWELIGLTEQKVFHETNYDFKRKHNKLNQYCQLIVAENGLIRHIRFAFEEKQLYNHLAKEFILSNATNKQIESNSIGFIRRAILDRTEIVLYYNLNTYNLGSKYSLSINSLKALLPAPN